MSAMSDLEAMRVLLQSDLISTQDAGKAIGKLIAKRISNLRFQVRRYRGAKSVTVRSFNTLREADAFCVHCLSTNTKPDTVDYGVHDTLDDDEDE